jgi:hypothetical protein
MKKSSVIITFGLGFGLAVASLTLGSVKHVLAADARKVRGDVESAERQPFEAQCNGQFLSATEAQCKIAVPSGKRLVVETVTGRVGVPIGVRVRDFTLTSTGAGAFVQNSFVATFMASDKTEDVFVVTAPVRIYVDQSTSVLLSVICNGPGPGVASVTLSGYLVNVQ